MDFSLLDSKLSTNGSGVVSLEGSNSCNSMNSPRQIFSAKDRMLLMFQYIPSWMLLSCSCIRRGRVEVIIEHGSWLAAMIAFNKKVAFP